MKIFSLFLLFLVSFTVVLSAQSKVIDSLENELAAHKLSDTKKVDILNTLANKYRRQNMSLAEETSIKANTLAKELNYEMGLAKNVLVLSKIHISKSEFDDAHKDALESLELYKKNKTTQPKDFIPVYNTLAMISNYRNNFEKGLEYFEKSLKIAKETNDLKGQASMLSNIAITYYKQGNLEKATDYIKESIAVSDEPDFTKGNLSAMNNLAVILSIQGRYVEALEYHTKILASHRKNNNRKSEAMTMHNMGILYSEIEQFEKAFAFFEEALQIHKEFKDELNTAQSLNSLGIVLTELKDYKKGLDYLTEALALNKKINNIEALVASHNAMGKIRIVLEQPQLALDHFKSALELSASVNDKRNIGNAHVNLAEIYVILKNYPKALQHAQQGKQIVDRLEMLEGQGHINKTLSDIYEATGDYAKALTSHQKYKSLNDSLFNKENVEKVAQIEYEYKFKQALDSASIRELKLTKTVMATSQDLEQTRSKLLLGIVIFLATASILGGSILSLKLRNAKSKNQNIVIEQKLLRSQMTPHFIFNSLSVLQGMILNKEEETSISYLSKFSKLLRTILENSRHKAVALSAELSAVNDYMALQNLDVDPPFKFKLSVASDIDQSAIKIPPMLIQPFIENATEHAFPNKRDDKQIDLELNFKDATLVCTIADNGIGVNLEKQRSHKNKNSLATKITSERLKILSKDYHQEGSVTIKNREIYGEQGTLVTLVIPYKTQIAS